MPNATRGVLLTCDPAMREYVLFLNKEQRFVIMELDETHLLVDAAVLKFLQQKLDQHYDECHYTLPSLAEASSRRS